MDSLISRFNSFSLSTGDLNSENLFLKSEKEFFHAPGSDTLVVCLPGWGQTLFSWMLVKRFIFRKRKSYLIYEYLRAILSNNQELTKNCFEAIDRTVRDEIRQLKEKFGYKKCTLVSISLASSFSSMIYKNNKDITEAVFIVPGESLARNMWFGCRTRHLRKEYEKQGVTLKQLQHFWKDLAPENNMPAKGTFMYLFYGIHDKVILYSQGKRLEDSLRLNNFEIKSKDFNLGHYLLCIRFLLFPRFFLKI